MAPRITNKTVRPINVHKNTRAPTVVHVDDNDNQAPAVEKVRSLDVSYINGDFAPNITEPEYNFSCDMISKSSIMKLVNNFTIIISAVIIITSLIIVGCVAYNGYHHGVVF